MRFDGVRIWPGRAALVEVRVGPMTLVESYDEIVRIDHPAWPAPAVSRVLHFDCGEEAADVAHQVAREMAGLP